MLSAPFTHESGSGPSDSIEPSQQAWIVEDDPDFTRQIIEALTNLTGFWRVANFPTEAALLEYALSGDSDPDLIPVDMGLPDIGGAEVIR